MRFAFIRRSVRSAGAFPFLASGLLAAAWMLAASSARAGDVTLSLTADREITFVGAFHRWDEDGNPRKKVNPKAKIEKPEVDFTAERKGSDWVFKKLPTGQYDFVVLLGERTRIEGFFYAPVLEFDPFFPADASTDDETRDFILDDIKKSPHYENRVVPMHLGGDEKSVRVLMMLIRDKTTSYEADLRGAATIRHEIWQYSNQHGGWVKERRTRVLDRAILNRDELRRWTWLWEPKLGGVRVGEKPLTLKYAVPKADDKKLRGLYPY